MISPLPDSRYFISDVVELEDGNLLTLPPDPIPYLNLDDDEIHVVQQGDDLFRIAAKYYKGTRRPASFFWAIAWYQPVPIKDAFAPLKPGREIIIPSFRTIQTLHLNASRDADDLLALRGRS